MKAEARRKLVAIARRQAGVVSAEQIAEAGLTAGGRRWLVAGEQWRRVAHRVYAVSAAPPSWQQRLWIVCLATGGVASHRTAGWLLGLDGVGRYPPRDLEVMVPFANKARAPGAKVRRSRTLVEGHVSKRAGPPCTNLARTIIDLSETLEAKPFRLAFDSGLRQQADLREWVGRVLSQMGAAGHRGIPQLRAMLAETDGPVDSALEVMVRELLRSARLPEVRTGVEVVEGDHFIAKLDFAWPDNQPPVALMAQGVRWHLTKDRLERDAAQVSELSGLGWRVIQCTMSQIEQEPETVLRNLRRALRGQTARIEHVGIHGLIDHNLK